MVRLVRVGIIVALAAVLVGCGVPLGGSMTVEQPVTNE